MIETGLACWLLESELGLTFLAPIIIVIACVIPSSDRALQNAWLRARANSANINADYQ